MDQFEQLCRGIPAIEEDGFGLDPFGTYGMQEHLTGMLEFGLAILVWSIDAVIDGPKFVRESTAMNQIDDANAADQSMFCSAILPFDEFDETGIPFVLDAIIEDETGIRLIFDLMLDKPPQISGPHPSGSQEIADYIMADIF